jgi:spermidine/putrescine transport system permease protein
MRKKKSSALETVYLGLILLILYAPILVLMYQSFTAVDIHAPREGQGGFTFQWYVRLFSNPTILAALQTTVLIAVLAAAISTVIGTLAAIGLYGMRHGMRTAVLNVTYLPVINPDIVTGVSLMILFTFMQLRLSFWTMLMAHLVFDIPYVMLAVMPRLTQLDRSVYEAALDLGATPGYALRKVILPEIMPGVVTGLILAFTLSIDDFVISYFTSSDVQNLSMYIFSASKHGINPAMYALMTLMFATVLVLLIIVNIRAERTAQKNNAKLRVKAEY